MFFVDKNYQFPLKCNVIGFFNLRKYEGGEFKPKIQAFVLNHERLIFKAINSYQPRFKDE